MNSIQELLATIDTSKMERGYVDTYDLFSSEFDIHQYLEQEEGKVRLTCCPYYTWICTDTGVGIYVWYFDDEPVCISFLPYRKSDTEYFWLDNDCFYKVRNYATTLLDKTNYKVIENLQPHILDSIIAQAEGIDYKQFEKKNIKL